MKRNMRRRAVPLGAGVFVAVGLAQAPRAEADPYQLPIASSGPVTAPMPVDPMTTSMQELARQVGLPAFTAPDWHVGPVRHIVMIRYKSGVTPAQRAEVTARFLHLAQDSRRPDGRPLIVNIESGGQNSGEGDARGFEQVFLVTFRSQGDRNYYVGRPVVTDPAFFDPAHEAFKEFAMPYLAKIMVFDFDVSLNSAPLVKRGPATSHRRRP